MPSGPSTKLAIIYSETSVLITVLDLAAEFGLSAINTPYPDADMSSPKNSQVILTGDGLEIDVETIEQFRDGIEELHGFECAELRICPRGQSVPAMEITL